uniref:Uncharacterized protein n=1 Tax=Ditylenchus dipsaci TaxID=166011 RepID=A0A915E6M8_9BILA
MIEIKKTDGRGRLKMLFNIHDNSSDSKPLVVSDAEWCFKIEKCLKDPPSKNSTLARYGDVFYVDERDMDMRHRTRRPFSAFSFLRATICCKRNCLDICLNTSYQVRMIGLSYDFVIKGNHHFNGHELEESIVLENFIKWNHIIDPYNGFHPGDHIDARSLEIFSSSTCFRMLTVCSLCRASEFMQVKIIWPFIPLFSRPYANVGCLVKMADRFQVFGVIDKCMHHIKYLSDMSIGQKLLLVQQIEQNELMMHCAEQCISEKEVHKISDELEELSPDTMCTLLDGILWRLEEFRHK